MCAIAMLPHSILLSVLILSAAPSALAVDSCAVHFHADGTTQDGLMFGTVQSFPGLEMHDVLKQMQKIAEADGFHFVKVNFTGTQGTLAVVQASSKARPFPVMITADQSRGLISIATHLQPGQSAKPQDIKNGMCGMLARVKVVPPTSPPSTLAQETSPSGSSNTSGMTNGVRDFDAPGSNPKVLTPTAAFDREAAQAALGSGSSTISGVACVKHQGMALASNQKIYLFPVTPYLQEWVELLHKAKPGKEQVRITNDVLAARMEAMTNAKGQFAFTNIKAGKYYLYTTLSSQKTNTVNVYDGQAEDNAGLTDYYHQETHTANYADVLDKFVEVAEGQALHTTLSPQYHVAMALLGRSGSAGPLGCHEF